MMLVCMCILSLCSCKKDYQKLATEYERSLPDTVQVVMEQVDDVDHLVYIYRGGELYKHDLDKNTDMIVKPQLEEDESISGIYVGKENLAFLVCTNAYVNTKFQTYNLKTQKFKDIALFRGTVYNDVEVEPSDSTISGFIVSNVESYIREFFDFDGNKVKKEDYDDPNLGDFDVPSRKYWQCFYCQTVVISSTKPARTDCPKRPVYLAHNHYYHPHDWQCIGDAN